MVTLFPLRNLVLALATLLAVPVAATAEDATPGALPPGLATFLEARSLESAGRLREAAEAYTDSLRQDPTQDEVRIRSASLLLELGRAEAALAVIDEATRLDWYGLRVRALALAQIAARRPERAEDAVNALRAVLEVRDDDPNLSLSLAQMLHRQGRIREAEEEVAALRQGQAGSVQLLLYHAALLSELGRPDEAAELLGDCAAAPLAVPVCRESLVEALIAAGRERAAGEAMLEWLGSDELDGLLKAATLLLRGGAATEALAVIRRVQAFEPDSPRAQALEARALTSAGRHQEAVELYRRLLKKDRENLDLLLPLAWSAAATGDTATAREAIGRAWEMVNDDAGSPAATQVCLMAARLELRMGYSLVAREWLGRIGDPALAGDELPGLIAETYRREEAWAEGIAALLRLQPKLAGRARLIARALEAEFRLRLGDDRAWQRLRPMLDGDDEVEAAIALDVLQALQRWQDVARETGAALARWPENRSIRFARAAALERLDRMDEAAPVFLGLLEENPDDLQAANYLAYAWADRGLELEEAHRLLVRVVEREPDNPAYLDSLGWVLYRLGRLEEAERWLRRAVEAGGTDGTILAHLGEVLLGLGQVEEGQRLLRQALERRPENPDRVRQLLEELDEPNDEQT